MSRLPAAPGERVRIGIGEVTGTALVTDGSVPVPRGELALRPGDAGWALPAGGERRFLEMFVDGGSAAERFGNPTTGAPIAVESRSGRS